MKVEIINHTPLEVALEAGLICTDSEDKIDQYNAEEFIGKLVKSGHESVIEHIYYNIRISGVSRALLQELARHRHASLSVKSTRWALKKIVNKDSIIEKVEPKLDEYGFSYAQIDVIESIAEASEQLEYWIKKAVQLNIPNDIVKYYIQESLCTKLMFTVNARELRHILQLRLSKRALKEFQDLCKEIYKALPKEHLFIYNDILEGYELI
jgi:thymidylate synthase (FAD)